MRPLRAEEILPLASYRRHRDAYRDRVIRYKANRRLQLGDKVMLLFEDRETLRFQVQEMCWIERIEAPERVADEIAVYNELIPGAHELSATLFVEITGMDEIRPELDRLIGIDEHVVLEVGDGADAEAIRARFDTKQLEEDRISAVQYIRFSLGEAAARRFCTEGVGARARIDHPRYRCEVELPADLRRALQADLRREPDSLLPADARAPVADELIYSDARVRVVRPGRAREPGHRIVEAIDPEATLLDGDPELMSALLEAVRTQAAEVAAEYGGARVETEVGAASGPQRWHVFAARR